MAKKPLIRLYLTCFTKKYIICRFMYTGLGVHGILRDHSQAEMYITVTFITTWCMGYESEVEIK